MVSNPAKTVQQKILPGILLLGLILFHIPACGGGGTSSQSGGNIQTGGLEEKWSVLTDDIIYSSPAFSDGTLYIGSNDGSLYALDRDGQLKWDFVTGDAVYSSPAIGKNGTIYVGSNDRKVYAINPDGTQKWAFPVGSMVYFSSPAVAPDGTMYIGTKGGMLYALSPSGGEVWSTQLEGWVSSPVIGRDGTIYVGSGNINWDNLSRSTGKLYARKPGNGSVKWEVDKSAFSKPAIGSDGTIYAGCTDGTFYALYPQDGQEKWHYQTGGPILSTPKVIEGNPDIIIFGSDDRTLYAFDSTGESLWQTPLDAVIRSSAEVGPNNNILYIGTNDGHLYAISTTNGTQKGYFKTTQPVTTIPKVGSDGTIYFGGQDNYVYALKGSIGIDPEF
jgi:outer membrane protein assembly factor BamB